jgi:sirohydrochlorin cobaltochelatase
MHTKKSRHREDLKERPAIVLAAFGSTRRGRSVYDLLESNVRDKFNNYDVSWAYTSSIIRQKTGKPGILQVLSSLEERGYTKAVVQPLMIFPGTEYTILADTCRSFPGLTVMTGESLLHRWEFVGPVLDIVSKDFISPEKGINLLVAHGTPLAGDSANIIYMGLAAMLSERYRNVFMCTVEGIPDSRGALNMIMERFSDARSRNTTLKACIIPFMYVAGLHVEEDLLGDQDSYKTRLEEMGFNVECPYVHYNGEQFYKGLGFYEEIRKFFLQRIVRALDLTRLYE